MKIVWFINSLLPAISHKLNLKPLVNEGWLIGLSSVMMNIENQPVELFILCPQYDFATICEGEVDGYHFIAYPQRKSKFLLNPELQKVFQALLKRICPNVIHIMGSEFPHCYSAVSACEKLGYLERTVISIQGLVSVCARHYCLGLPFKIQRAVSLRDKLKRHCVLKDKNKFDIRGKYERLAFQKCPNAIGRTEWDYACVKQFNPKINYYFNNETLRPSFYCKTWDYEECEKNTIFFSQATYPIKGFHFMIEALTIIKKSIPNVRLYVAGSVVLALKKTYPSWKRTTYENYIFKLIKEGGLVDTVMFLGILNEKEMCDQYLKSNVFVSASTIENSSNSVGEAMLLGVPVVSSNVGGISSILTHEKEGYLYPADEPYMLAHYVCKILLDSSLAKTLSKASNARAKITHNKDKNVDELITIYKNIAWI